MVLGRRVFKRDVAELDLMHQLKSEVRISKSETTRSSQIRNPKIKLSVFKFLRLLIISICFGFLISSFEFSPSDGFHHSPAAYCPLLDRLEDQSLKSEANDADNRQACHHHVGVEKFLRVEDDPSQPPIRGGDHLTAYDSDPSSGERLAKAGDHERQRSWQDDFLEERPLVGLHRFGRADPEAIDGSHAGPGIEDRREGRGVKDQRDGGRVSETESEDENRNPSQRGDRHENTHQRNEETLHAPKAPHQDADENSDRTCQYKPEE